MVYKVCIIVILSCILMFSGCVQIPEEKMLGRAYDYLEEYPDSVNMPTQPDSALEILNNIDFDNLTSDRLKAMHALLLAHACYKKFIPLKSDSLLNFACIYFNRQKEDYNLMKSLFFLGYLYFDNGRPEKAIVVASKAYEIAFDNNYEYWLAKIAQLKGDILSNTCNWEQAAECHLEAMNYFDKYGKHRDALFAASDYAINLSGSSRLSKAILLFDSINNIASGEPIDSVLLINNTKQKFACLVDKGMFMAADSCLNLISEVINIENASSSYFYYNSRIALYKEDLKAAERFLELADSLSVLPEDSGRVYQGKSLLYDMKGDYKKSLLYEDSASSLQNRLVYDILRQSVVAAQRDYYDVKAVREKERASDFRNALIISIVLALLLAILFWTFHRLRIRKKNLEIQKKATDIMLISTELDDSIKENSRLSEVVSEKEDALRHMADKLNLNLHNLELLQADLKARGEEVDILSLRLTETDRKLDMTGKELAEAVAELSDARDNEMRLKSKVESLFRNRNEFFYKISEIYITKKNSPTVKKTIISDFEDMFRKMRKEISRENVEKEVNAHMDNILVELREKCSTLSDEDLMMTALIYAGYMPRFVSEMCGYTYKYFYTKRDRIIRKIEQSIADNDRMRFIDPLRK